MPCAGDGPPIYAGPEGFGAASAFEPTGSVTLRAVPWAGRDSSRRSGDPTSGAGVDLARARLGLCGATDDLAYRIVWEPWDEGERARSDAGAWGRLVEAQVAWRPWDFAAVSVGIGKVPFSRGREQPAGALPFALLPHAIAAIAPDRRFGLSADFDVGVARIAAGIYQGARQPDLDAPGGVLVAARLILEPYGPVGRRLWPEYGPWTSRLRGAGGLSGAYRRTDRTSGYAVGGDLALSWRRVAFDAEVLFADGWPLERPAVAPDTRARRIGGYLEAVVLAWTPWLSVAARVEYLDEDLAAAGRGRFVAFAAGASGWLLGPSLQLQATYTRKLHLAGSYADDALLIALTVAR